MSQHKEAPGGGDNLHLQMVDWSGRERRQGVGVGGGGSAVRNEEIPPWPQQIEDRKHLHLHTTSPPGMQHVQGRGGGGLSGGRDVPDDVHRPRQQQT